MRIKAFVPLAVLVFAIEAGSVLALDEAPPKEAYVPGLGEFMSSIQMRHMKLWAAGSKKNWDLAGYELGEIEEGFGNAARFNPVFKGIPVAELIGRITSRPLKDLDKAVEAKDMPGFEAAFDALTSACNECHRAAKHGFIVIRRPVASPFSDQAFGPK